MPNEFIDLSAKNIRVWFLLAFQAGAVNAGGFIACHRFVTHTTGFATHFAFELATHHEGAALGMLSVPFFFLLGAVITSYFVDLPLTHGKPANYTIPGFLIFFCLAAALLLGRLGLFGNFNNDMTFREDYILLVLLCLASGLQNALITNASGVVVRTTHLTGVTTDLAVGLVRTFFGRKSWNPQRLAHERLATLARGGIIGSFVVGSTISAYLFLKTQYLGFAVPVFTSLILLRYFVNRTKMKEFRMRTLTLTILAALTLASAAQAAPEVAPPAAGTYAYQGAFRVASRIHFEVAYAFTDAGREKLARLQKEGYECWPKPRETWLCKAFLSTDGAADIVRSRVEREMSGKQLVLGALRGEPGLISKGSEVAEYLVPQTASFNGTNYDSYRWMTIGQGLWSARLGEKTEAQFNLGEGGTLTFPLNVAVTESNTAYTVYFVLADFLRM